MVDLLAAADLMEGKPQLVEHGRIPVLPLRHDNNSYAVEGWCSHVGGPLIEGSFEGLTVTCPWHKSCFRLDDGRPIHGTTAVSLRTFAVQERDGRMFALPSDAGRAWPPSPASPKE